MVVELAGRDVHGHLHRAAVQAVEAYRFSAAFDERPLAEVHDEPRVLCEGDELARRELAEGRMLPADERLVAGDLVAVEVYDCLVIEPELSAADPVAQLRDSLRALDGDAVELGVEEGVTDVGMAFCAVHRDVGLPQQRLVVVPEGDADARARLEDAGAALQRTGDLVEQPLGHTHRVVGGERLCQNDSELVAAEPGGGVAGPNRPLDPSADLVQHLVAEVVAPTVVDSLEAVEVDVEQPGRLPLLAAEHDRVAQPLVEEGAVGETGQRVVEG